MSDIIFDKNCKYPYEKCICKTEQTQDLLDKLEINYKVINNYKLQLIEYFEAGKLLKSQNEKLVKELNYIKEKFPYQYHQMKLEVKYEIN